MYVLVFVSVKDFSDFKSVLANFRSFVTDSQAIDCTASDCGRISSTDFSLNEHFGPQIATPACDRLIRQHAVKSA
jgi:hypothetical protein